MHRTALIAIYMATLVGCSPKTDNHQTNNSEKFSMPDNELVDSTFKRIIKHYGEDFDPSKIPKPQQAVVFVYHADGIIGNGGFQYLFEGDFPGDPEFLLTRQAYKTIGASDASAAFEKAFAVFPNSTPPANINRRLRIWQSKYKLLDSSRDATSPDSMYLKASKGVMEKLKAYIKANESEFASLSK